jgi:hypothetical protein
MIVKKIYKKIRRIVLQEDNMLKVIGLILFYLFLITLWLYIGCGLGWGLMSLIDWVIVNVNFFLLRAFIVIFLMVVLGFGGVFYFIFLPGMFMAGNPPRLIK